MNNTRLKELLDKYLDGTATDIEISEVDRWYRSFENDPAFTEQFSAEQRTALEQLLFLRISRQVEAAEPPIRVSYRAVRWVAAATVALLIAAGGFYLTRTHTTPPANALATLTAQTGKNGIKKIILPDSSIVWLNIDSKIRYAAKKGREVWLEGEGYFEVAPQQGAPFLVHAGALNINVLGTSFNIDAYTTDAKVTVTVASGKVAVGSEQANTTLVANQQAIYLTAANQMETSNIAAADFSAWTQGQLIFKKALFRDIAQKLERRYEVRIRFTSEQIANSLLTARFDANVPFKNVLGMLCDIYGFSYRQESGKNEYVVYKKGQSGK